MNAVKHKGRINHCDDTFEAAVFHTCNMPKMHELNFDAPMENRLPMFGNWPLSKLKNEEGDVEGNEFTSKLFRRHLAKETPWRNKPPYGLGRFLSEGFLWINLLRAI